MNIKVMKIREDAKIPVRASNYAVGYDVFASRVLDKKTKEVISGLPVRISAGGSTLIGIGVKFAIPWPLQCEVRPRSGLASKYDIELSNSPGTIDPDFRGEAGVLLRNRGEKPFIVEKDMRIAQLIFSQVEIPILEESPELPSTIRGIGGFGSTGLFKVKEGTDEYECLIKEKDQFFMKIAMAVADRSNCIRGGRKRKFGCVIVKDDNVVSMGYNAQHKGAPLCADIGCLREQENIPSGTKIERCRAVHAEWYAFANLMISGGVSTKGATIYLTAEPCEVCAKLIIHTQIETMVLVKGTYPTNGTKILREAGINIRYVDLGE